MNKEKPVRFQVPSESDMLEKYYDFELTISRKSTTGGKTSVQ